MIEILKASLLTFFSKKVRDKGVCGKVPKPLRPRNARSLLQPPLTGEVAERSDGRRGFGRYPLAPASRESTGPGMPGPYNAAK